MPRSPRRSRSPEQGRPSHRSAHRSSSPSRYDRDRRDDRERERHRSDRDRDRDRDRSRRDDRDRDRRRYDDDRYVRDRSRDRDRDRARDRDRERDRDRDRYDRRKDDRDDRRRDDRDDRDRDRYRDDRRDDRRRDDSRDRERRRDDRDRDRGNGYRETSRREIADGRSPQSNMSSPAPQSEEEKQRLKRERLEAWKKSRELAKSRTASATPEPEKAAAAAPKAKSGLSFNSQRIGISLKPTTLKRSITALDDEEEDDRKLQKLDLPAFDPQVQSGTEANLDPVTEDLAAAEGDDNENDSVAKDSELPKTNGNGEGNGKGNGEFSKMDVDDEEDDEDPLDAFMKANTEVVKTVNKADAQRSGLIDDESDDEPEVRNRAEEELAKAEALLHMAATKQRKKDLPTPDHSQINYEPFRKNFYSAPLEVTELDEEQIELQRLVMDGVKIRGVDAPRPVRNWGALGLSPACLEIIRHNQWKEPTPIQAQSIPAIMMGRDVIGIAKTGSGKTIAFLLPMLRHVKDQRPVSGFDGPIALILAPTRELAMQIHKESKPFAKVMNLRVSCCVGGQSISEDIAALRRGAEIVVCTPGRMIDLLTSNNGRVTNLRRVTFIVMDEADRMFDMGFEPQVMKITNNMRPDAQKVLFSATFPKSMESLARKILVKPLEITVGGRSVVAAEIDQRVEVRDADTKFNRLLEILGEISIEHPDDPNFRTLIFVDRQEAADDLFRELLGRGYLCASLHGGKEQVDRLEAIKDFKNGDLPMLVATSVAARGLDVKELKLVINYDAPNHMEDYIHRAGRTGRAGNTGTCITFITPEQEKFSVDLLRALEASKAFIPDQLKSMAEKFIGKIKSGQAQAARSGFKGKGLDQLQRRRDEKDRAEKVTYGDTSEAVSLSSREGAVIPYKPKNESTKSSGERGKTEGDYTFTDIDVQVVHGPAPDTLPSGPAQRATRAEAARLPATTLAALEQARREGRHIDAVNLARVAASLTHQAKAAALGAAMPVDPNRKTKDPDATDWHALFPINDYPQKARWKATNKEHMMMLSEISGASITMRGAYYPPGEEPAPGQVPKLHLLIESNEEMRVRRAVDELRRTLVEASVQALNSVDRAGPSTGRYTV